MLTGQSESLKEWICENAQVTLFLSYTLNSQLFKLKNSSIKQSKVLSP